MLKAWLNQKGDHADLSRETQAKASALHTAAESGARFLALPVEDTRDAVTWILACFHSPVSVVPLPPSLPLPALEARIAQFPAGSVVFPGALKIAKPEDSAFPQRALHEIWAVIFSSGSSGEPKGIALTGDALRASALAHAKHSGAGQACWLLDLPLYHIGGLSVITRALFLNASIALGGAKFDAEHCAAWIESGLVQGLSLVPTTLFRLLKMETDFSRLQLVLLGGAPAEASVVEKALERKIPLRLTYGMTEHCSQIATEIAPGSGFVPLPGVELRMATDGEILVRSSCLASGIYSKGTLQPLTLENGFFATGDLGAVSGGALRFLGRKSDMIVTGGLKVFPAEVEREISRLDGVSDCGVTGLADPEWGEVLYAAVVETEPGSLNPQLFREKLKSALEQRKIPKNWVLLGSIPRSATGKILRTELRATVERTIPTRS